MQTAKLFPNGQSQAVRLPKEFRFEGSEVYIKKIGDVVLLYPVKDSWKVFLDGLDSFTDDFMEDGRGDDFGDEREPL